MTSETSRSPDSEEAAGEPAHTLGETAPRGEVSPDEAPGGEPEAGDARSGGLWSELVAAVRGKHEQDYTEGPLGRAILLLAVPMVLETLMESIFAVVDVFFVSRLGPAQVATVGLTESMMAVVYSVAIGLCIGVTAMVARRTGEKDSEGAARTAFQAVLLGFATAGLIGIIGAIYAPDLLRLMGAEEEVVQVGTGYTRVMLGGNATVFLLFLINAIFRGAGDAVIAMRVLWLANGINLILDPCLIFGLGPFPEMGVLGAAVATNIGRGIAVAVQIYTLVRSTGRIRIERRHMSFVPKIMSRLVRLSGTGMQQFFIGTASWIGLMRILAGFGSEVVAGYTIAIRVVVFALFPSWGMSNAAATLVGQALGAEKPERAEQAVWRTSFYNMLFLGIVGTLYAVFAPQIVGIFTSDPEPARWGVDCLRIVSLGFAFYAYGMVVSQSFNGAGDTWTPTRLNFFCFWLVEIPLGFVLAYYTGLGPTGVFIAITVAFSLLAVVSVIVFRRGEWKHKIV
ncbi:MAG: MATE family efflux transporter [Holophagales bacterium]|nr:MATE family efflux transporter [Holophagales bacterium]